LPRLLRAGRGIQEGERLAVDLLLEDREIRPQRASVQLGHGLNSHSQMVTRSITSTSNRSSAHCPQLVGTLTHRTRTAPRTRGKGRTRGADRARLRRRVRRREDPRPGPRQGEGEASGRSLVVRARRPEQRPPERSDRAAGSAARSVELDVVSVGAVARSRAMGCDVAVAGGDPAAIAAILERWEAAFSLFRHDSELCRVNRSPGRVLVVSSLFAGALEVALEMATATEGLVDPTLCGRWTEIVLSGRMLSRPPGLTLDLNGVVKALAVDEAAATLDEPGFVSV